jgi:hypothetical protein
LWNSTISNIENAGVPLYYSIVPGAENTTVRLYPANEAYPITLTAQTVVAEYGLNDAIQLPAGYYPALQSELSVYLAQYYSNYDALPKLTEMATKALGRVKRLNNHPRRLKVSGAPGKRTRYNIYSGTYYP